MKQEQTTTLDLDRMALRHGQGKRIELPVWPGRFELGGQTYSAVPETVSARIDISRTTTGHALQLRLSLGIQGPCMRCLGPAVHELQVDAREVDQPSTDDEDLRSPYVEAGELDLSAWAHDAIVLALPVQILCRPDCAGLCPGCGESLNDADPADHDHGAAADPRWAKLNDLKLD